MAFSDLVKGRAADYPLGTSERFKTLDSFERLRDGRMYEHLEYPFSQEKNGQTYIPMMERRPATILKIAKLVTNQTAALTFGDEHAPTVRCIRNTANATDENPFEIVEQCAEKIVDRLDLESIMMDAVFEGSIGGCAIILRAVGNAKAAYIEVKSAKFCRPVFDIMNPLDLIGLVQIYPTKGQDLLDVGYTEAELTPPRQLENGKGLPDFQIATHDYWMRIEISAREEIRFKPLTAEQYQRLGQIDPLTTKPITWERDDLRSASHHFGVVPVVYIRQGKVSGIDGECFFADVADIMIELDYLLSQVGRALRYSADPLLAISRGELATQNIAGPIGENTLKGPEGGLAKTAANVLELEQGADAKLLEITGKGLDVAIEHISKLREFALEVMSGMKSESQHEKGVQSGAAMDKLWEALKLLIKRLRIPYGNRGLIPLLRLIMTGVKTGAIVIEDVTIEECDPDAPFRLIWPQTQLPTGTDLMAEATAVTLLAGASRSQGVRVLGDDLLTRFMAQRLGITDPTAAIKERDDDREDDLTQAAELADADTERQTKIATAKGAAKPPVAPPKK